MDFRKEKIGALAIVIALALFSIVANAQSTNEAVCKLYRGSRFSGSGTLIGASPDGSAALVISCYHVCGKSPTFDCMFANAPAIASQRYHGQVFKLSRQWDLAAIVLQNPGIPPAAIGDFTIQHEGIYSACGYGAGRYSAARGRVLGMSNAIIQTRCGIYGGHSGGGLFDPYGRWCGVTNWSTNNRAPMVNGVTKSRTGEPLQQFVTEAFNECGPFRKLFSRGGGGGGGDGGDCPEGGCPNPNLTGGGYGLAPGYTPLTPLASQPQAQPQAVTPPAVVTPPPATQVTVAVPPTTQPAPVPDEPKPEQPFIDPVAALAQQLEAVYRSEREQAAATAAMAAYRAAMNGEASTPVVQRLSKQEIAEAKEPSSLVTNLPVVTMSVEYRENDGRIRVESAKIDFATYVRQQFGLGGEEK